MHHAAIAGPDFSVTDPRVFGKFRGKENIDVVEGSLRGNGVGRRYFVHDVRLDVPAIAPLHRRRLVLGISFGRACIDPVCYFFDFAVAQLSFVCKVTDLGIGKPWRHLSGEDRFLDRLCPWARPFVCEKRHGTDLPGPMTHLAILLKNRKHVFVERHYVRRRRQRRCSHHQEIEKKSHDGILSGKGGQ